jgi:hypothetical protein
MNITIVVPLAPSLEVTKYSLNVPKEVKLITVRGLNPSENRNKGIKKAKTPLVAFINGHTIISDDWKKNVELFFKEHPEVDIVGGPQHTWAEDNGFARASGYAMSSLFGAGGVRGRYSGTKVIFDADETHLTSANLICRKKVFDKIKFDETLYPGEDPKFISDAKKAGFKIAYSPDIIVYNRRRETPASLMKQVYEYGKTRPRKEYLTETITKHPFFIIPSLFVLYLVFLPLFLLINVLIFQNAYAILILSPLILYLILNFFFSVGNPLLFAIFPIIHVSYGIGFLYGTLNNPYLSDEMAYELIGKLDYLFSRGDRWNDRWS